MTLAALIQKGGLQRIANANPAKAANDEGQRARPLAGLATLALAMPLDAQREAYEERAAILEYEAGIPRDIAEAMARRQVYGRTH
jgi:hypothetical protein